MNIRDIFVAHAAYQNFYTIEHPLIAHYLTALRDKNCSTPQFRHNLKQIGRLLSFAVSSDLPTQNRQVETPLEVMTGVEVTAAQQPVLVPVLRAGLGLSDGMLDMLEYAEVGHIGVARDHVTHMPTEYLIKLPEGLSEKHVYLIDPMLATGNSAIHAASVLLQHGAKLQNIKLVTLVSAPEGVKKFHAKYPEIPVISCALDKKLNENAYIVTGLGDAGDRIFGTK